MQKKNENALRPWAYLAGFGMVGASSGLFTCISTLLLLSRGLSLSMASLAMSLNFITVLVLEMPSGMAGDLWGRKRVWILSRILSLAGVFCFCFGNIPVVLLGNILFGAGVAFSSGTLDALYMERWMHARGKESTGKAGMWSSIVQYGCQALGSLVGGVLSSTPFLGYQYGANLMLMAALLLVAIFWVIGTVPEDSRKKTVSMKKGNPLGEMASQGKKALLAARHSPVLLVILLGAGILGFTTSGVEIYWQPQLQTLAGEGEFGLLLGLLSSGSMIAVVLGNILAAQISARIPTEKGRVALYFLSRLAMTLCMVLAACLLRLPAFCTFYILYYLAMGWQDNADAVLLHQSAEDAVRGTIMSAESLALRLGGLVSQLLSAAVLAVTGIPILWLLLAAVLGMGALFCGAGYWLSCRKKAKPAAPLPEKMK